jgi:hypothetical protein
MFGTERRTRSSLAHRRALWASLVGFVALLAFSGQGYAQAMDDASALDQYVERPHTATGDSPGPGGGGGGGPSTGAPLPDDIQQQIAAEGGADAPALQAIASQPVYGAPQRQLGDGKTAALGTDESGGPTTAVGTEDALSAAVSAVRGGDSGRLAGLLVVLALVSVATLAAAGLRHRRRLT